MWAALDDNIKTTANEIMRKAEKSKQITNVSTSCGTSPIREVTKTKEISKIQQNVKETGTSPPPQSISTQVGIILLSPYLVGLIFIIFFIQTYDTLPLRQREPSETNRTETPPTGSGGVFYKENTQVCR